MIKFAYSNIGWILGKINKQNSLMIWFENTIWLRNMKIIIKLTITIEITVIIIKCWHLFVLVLHHGQLSHSCIMVEFQFGIAKHYFDADHKILCS
jgi:hypothetical protein